MVKEETKQPQDEVPRIEYTPPSSFSTDMQVCELHTHCLVFILDCAISSGRALHSLSLQVAYLIICLPFSLIPLRSVRTDRTSQ
jgi:hypothetical protein